MKSVIFSAHARDQMRYRGATEAEVIDAINETEWSTAALGRLECEKDFPYNGEWNGEHYQTKKVRPIFVDEESVIVIVTVYAYYF